MKYRFVEHDGRWYVVSADQFNDFLDTCYAETCAEDEFREDGDSDANLTQLIAEIKSQPAPEVK